MKPTPWFAVRDFGDGQSLAVLHWKGAAAIAATLLLGGGGLLGAWLLLGRDGAALAAGLAFWLASLLVLFVSVRRRIVDERRRP